MGFPYGQQFDSARKEVLKATKQLVSDGKKAAPGWLDDAHSGKPFGALTKWIWYATFAEVEKPKAGRDYTRAVVKEWQRLAPDQPVAWTSPSGFPIVLPYHTGGARSGQVRGIVNGHRVNSRYLIGKGGVDWERAKGSMAPNFIHSLDGAHVALSLTRAAGLGVTQLACVHDAFGTTPSRTDELRAVLREEFARMYLEHDSLKELEARLKAVGGENLPPMPERGTLDASEIARADYLFS
jgi:DNA-directed RNA polymerase